MDQNLMEMKQEKKKGKGRQKIEIKKIDCKKNRVVTFSKRKAGLFKKASELSILCGVDVAVLVFSPTEDLLSYGSPSVQAVLERYLKNRNSAREATPVDAVADRVDVEASKFEYLELLKQLEAEKIRSELIKKSSTSSPSNEDEDDFNWENLDFSGPFLQDWDNDHSSPFC